MIQVAEIMYIVPEKREAFLQQLLNPSLQEQQIAWMYGIRNKCFYRMNELILETFDYVGKNFHKDMQEYTAHPVIAPTLVSTRRRDVPITELGRTNWWAPIKVEGRILLESPMPDDEEEEPLTEMYRSMVNGEMIDSVSEHDLTYDEDDWSESIHI
ncbi:MAG: hypothetical protein V8S26_08305 [Lachnospiraceae bacterium]